jgi:hypothetical protein
MAATGGTPKNSPPISLPSQESIPAQLSSSHAFLLRESPPSPAYTRAREAGPHQVTKKPDGWTDEAWAAEVLRKPIVIADRKARRKEALAKKMSEDQMAYEAARFDEQ